VRNGQSILFVDDEVDFLEQFPPFFRQNYRVSVADDFNVDQEIDKNTYDYVSLDIDMNVKDGIQIYQEVRRRDQRSRIFVLTSLPLNNKKVKWFTSKGIPVFNKYEVKCADKIKAHLERFCFYEAKDLSVLIVDDEQEQQDMYVEVLEGIGFVKIETCRSPEEASQLIAQRTFDIYIVDMCFGEGAQLLFRGGEVVTMVEQTKDFPTSVVIPITTRLLARNYLKGIGKSQNIMPHFLDQSKPFIEKIEEILRRGPFKVRYA